MANKPRQLSPRAAAASALFQVVDQGQSLSAVLPRLLGQVEAKDHGLVQEICFGVLRWLPRLEWVIQQLMERPLTGKSRSAHFLLIVGVYQLFYMRIPAHAALSETVEATRDLKFGHLKKLINGVLRSAQRKQDELVAALEQNDKLQDCHPSWLRKQLQQAYPEQWQDIVAANNQQAPMWLRVNAQHHSASAYQQLLAEQGIEASLCERAAQAIRLHKAQPVGKLPGFEQGHSSVQDGAAQMAASLLDAQPGERVLDACAAPGGKTCHILELQPELAHLMAIDADAQRLQRVEQNLQRIGLQAELLCADASQPDEWNSEPFDRILLDAPCSATGVVRRHPDIKWLRRASDIDELVDLQGKILRAMWQQLKPGGVLLYATCSVLPQENAQQVARFLAETDDAELVPVSDGESVTQPGWQLLPGEQHMDGFYYAKLRKQGE